MALTDAQRWGAVTYTSYGFQHPETGWPVSVELLEGSRWAGLMLDAWAMDPRHREPAEDQDGWAEAEALAAALTGRVFPDEDAVRRHLIDGCGVGRYDL